MHPEEEYNEANKRHTMSHPPERIPDVDNQTPAKVKSPKDKKEKVRSFFITLSGFKVVMGELFYSLQS